MKNIIFDWSGVVRDSVTSQLWIVNRIFKKYGVGEITPEEFRENWKQPPVLFYQKYLPDGYNEEERKKLFRELQLNAECPRPVPFSGVVKLIHKCKKAGYFIVVVSSDLPETLLPEVKEYGLENTFSEVIVEANNKLEAVQRIIRSNHLNLQDTFFVGDSNHEIDVSKKAGIKSVAVTWGFVSERKLRAGNPDYIAHDPVELESVILSARDSNQQ